MAGGRFTWADEEEEAAGNSWDNITGGTRMDHNGISKRWKFYWSHRLILMPASMLIMNRYAAT